MKILFISLIILLPPTAILQQKNKKTENKEMITRIRNGGPNRDIAIFVKNLSDNITFSQSYADWGEVKISNCFKTGIGKEAVCHFEKAYHTATGVSAVLTFSLGLFTGSYAAVIFSVPYNRISAGNWFGVHLVKKRFANKTMYDELYDKAYKYVSSESGTDSESTTWINVTDGFYWVNVTMSHYGICDMEVILSGKGGSGHNTGLEPTTAATLGLIFSFLQFASESTYFPLAFYSTIGIKLEVFNHNLVGGGVSTDTYVSYGVCPVRGGNTGLSGLSTNWIFEKTAYGFLGSSGVLTLQSQSWNVAPYNGITIWVYWYIPYSGLLNNYFGFHLTGLSSAAEGGEFQWLKSTDERDDRNRHVIKVPHDTRNFAIAFGNNVSVSGGGVVNSGYIIEGTFTSTLLSAVPISVMKVDDVYRAMVYRVRNGDLHHFLYCDIGPPRRECIKYHGVGVEKGPGFSIELGSS